jgi:hypothetical protein
LADPANVFTDVIRPFKGLPMANRSAPSPSDWPNIDPRFPGPRPLGRLFAWGSAATIALVAAALTSQTDVGSRRLQFALAHFSEPARAVAQIPPRTAENEREIRRLAAEVRTLAADRERLTARLASLERNLDGVTGSIKQQAVPAAAVPENPPSPNTPAAAPATDLRAPPPALMPPPPAALSETASAPAAPSPPQPSVTGLVPLPPARVATASPREAEPAPLPPTKPEFGIDLGGASSIEALRVQWTALKANYGPLLTGLHPLIAERRRQPGGTDYRLLAGPLPTIGVAAQLCTRFAPARTGCRPAKFVGVTLAER